MSDTIVFTGNGVTYGTKIGDERVTFNEVSIDASILSVSSEVSLSGGNLRVSLPEEIEWDIQVEDSVGKLVRK